MGKTGVHLCIVFGNSALPNIEIKNFNNRLAARLAQIKKDVRTQKQSSVNW